MKIIAKLYGKTIQIQELRDSSETTREDSNLLFLSDAAEKIGFRTLGVKSDLKSLEEAPLPCVLHCNQNHYIVVYKIRKGTYYISNPAFGLIEYSTEDLIKFWIGNNADESTQERIALLSKATPKFFESEFDKEDKKELRFGLLSQYVL